MNNSASMGEVRLDRARIRRMARHVAAGLSSLGVGAEEAVTLLMRNDPEFLSVVVGIELLGATATPVNWHFTAVEISHVVLDSGARALFALTEMKRLNPDYVLVDYHMALVFERLDLRAAAEAKMLYASEQAENEFIRNRSAAALIEMENGESLSDAYILRGH